MSIEEDFRKVVEEAKEVLLHPDPETGKTWFEHGHERGWSLAQMLNTAACKKPVDEAGERSQTKEPFEDSPASLSRLKTPLESSPPPTTRRSLSSRLGR